MPARLKGGRVQQPPATSGQSLSSLPPKTGAADRTQSPHSRPTTTQASPCENALAAHRVPQIQYPVSRPSVSPAPRGDLSEGVESRLEPFAGACWLAAPTPIAASLPTQRLCGAGLVSLDFSRPFALFRRRTRFSLPTSSWKLHTATPGPAGFPIEHDSDSSHTSFYYGPFLRPRPCISGCRCDARPRADVNKQKASARSSSLPTYQVPT